MDKVVDIIVLDDGDDDDEGPSCSVEVRESPSEPSSPPQPPPTSETSSNEKKDDAIGQNKPSMSAENQKLFKEFIDYSSKLTIEHPEVIAFLESRFSKTNPTYLSSVEFRNALGRCLSRLQSKQSKVYVYINELCTLLKSHSEKKKVTLQTQAAAPQHKKEETETVTEDAQEEVPERKAGSKHQIRRLENLLRLYSREIQKLQEKELSLEELEDEDSTYIQESRLKQKLIRIYEKLCELKDCSSLTGRVIEQRIQYKGTRYQEVNRRLEKFINKTRDIFPDYGDVLREVQKANEKHKLGLPRKQIQGIAQDAFRDLGNKLQHRRHLDMVYNFGCHLTDTYKSGHDPAENDGSLARRLRENRSLAEDRLENVIKKFAVMQDEGEEEDWKNKNQDDELPSTSKSVKDSPRSKKTESSKSDESEDEEEEEEDEESEESDVDIEEELRQSQEAADGEEEEEPPGDYMNEIDQRMEETSDPQNSSPADKEGENEETDNSDQDRDDEDAEEGTDKDEDESSAVTSLSPDKEEQNAELEEETTNPASSGDSNDAHLVSDTQEEDHDEQETNHVTPSATSSKANSPDHVEEALLMSVTEEDFVGYSSNNSEIVDVPYVEADLPSSKEQGTSKCTDTTNDLEKDPKSPVIQAKEGKSSRLDKCISKLAGGLTHKVLVHANTATTAPRDNQCSRRVKNKNRLLSGRTPRTEEQSSNGKLVCVDTPIERWDPVRKIAFSHSRSAGENPDVVHLDNYKNLMRRDGSNGVHRAVAMTSSPINRLKRKRVPDTPTDSVFTVKAEELGSQRRKRKPSAQLWTQNGVASYKGEENGKQQKLMRPKLSSSYTSFSCPSEPCSDNEHDITLDLMVTCSPQVAPTKTPSWRKKTDAATQCDPDEVIVLSD